MSAEDPATVTADPNARTPANEPPRSPLMLLAVIAFMLIALLVFGALDS